MLTISGADWFSRRGGTCRLHAIYEPTVRGMEIAKEIVNYGSAAWHPRRRHALDGNMLVSVLAGNPRKSIISPNIARFAPFASQMRFPVATTLTSP
jgi:hypothetical protein